jgi:hypothetical protein
MGRIAPLTFSHSSEDTALLENVIVAPPKTDYRKGRSGLKILRRGDDDEDDNDYVLTR